MEYQASNYSAHRSASGASAAASVRPGGVRGLLLTVVEGLQSIGSHFQSRRSKLFLALGLTLLFLFFLYPPICQLYAASRTNATLTAQLEALDQQNEAVSNEISALQTTEGIQDEARRRGYVEVGATPVIVTGLPEEKTGDELAGNGAISLKTREEVPWYTALFDFIFQYTPPA